MDASKVQTETQRQRGQEDQPRLVLRCGGLIADWLVTTKCYRFLLPPLSLRSSVLLYLVYSQSSFL